MPYPPAAQPVVKHIVDVPRAHAAGIRLVSVGINFGAAIDHPAFSVLAEDERCHAKRFLRSEDALRFSATRLVLREAIGELLDAPPNSLRFERDTNGRPRLTSHAPSPSSEHNAFDFNVSHSGCHALIALAKGRRVGVDIEFVDRRSDWRALAPAVFSPRDQAYVMSLPEDLRRDAFYKAWTAKEALLKALGTGIGAGMRHFSVLGSVDDTPIPMPAPPSMEFGVHHSACVTAFDTAWCPAPAGYIACVAWS